MEHLQFDQVLLDKSIALIGMPGSGKSTVGRQLARRLGLDLVDSDALIEQRVKCPIRAFFEVEGEDRFRDIEQEVIVDIAVKAGHVIATGGGAVMREPSRAALRAGCHVVYLRSTPEELLRRLRHDTQRPLLQVRDPLRRLRELFAVRDSLYRETAHYVVDTGRPSVPMLVNMVLMQLELAGLVDPRTAAPRGPHR